VRSAAIQDMLFTTHTPIPTRTVLAASRMEQSVKSV
jgi:hypothetical protein